MFFLNFYVSDHFFILSRIKKTFLAICQSISTYLIFRFKFINFIVLLLDFRCLNPVQQTQHGSIKSLRTIEIIVWFFLDNRNIIMYVSHFCWLGIFQLDLIWCDYFRDNLLNLAESGVKAITIAPELCKIFALTNLLDKDKNQRWVLREPQLRSLPSFPRATDQTSRVDSPSTINIADQLTRSGHGSDLHSHKQSHPRLTIFQIYLIHFT